MPDFDDPIDRRRFLIGAGTGAATLALYGCGGGGSGSTSTSSRGLGGRTGATARKVPKPRRASLGDLRTDVKGKVLSRSSPGYRSASEVYNERFDGARPLAIVKASSTADVSAAVLWAGRRDVSIVPRGGGHSYAGYSTGDDVLVLDLTELRSVTINRNAGTADIGPGAQLIDVYAALAAAGMTTPAGSCPSVGAGGHVPVGGMGLAGRKLGLACDNLESATVVTADGKVAKASSGSEQDLYWALRGAGAGNFGVSTSYEMALHPVSSVSYFSISWPWSAASDAIDAWQRFMPDAPDELTSVFHLSTGVSAPSVSANGQFFGAERKLRSLLGPLLVSGADMNTGTRGYLDMMRYWAGCASGGLIACHTAQTRPGGTLPRSYFDAKSDYVGKPLPAAGRKALVAAINTRQADPGAGSGAILFDSYGGAINKVSPSSSAFVHRNELYAVQYLAYYPGPADFTRADTWLQTSWKSMRPFVSGSAYQGYIDRSLKGWEAAYYGANYSRLQSIKKDYDPDSRFWFPQAVRPA